jgi:putative ABC transport system permease protein
VVIVQAINRKLMRDLWSLRGQAIAVCLVISCGIAISVMSLSTLESLTDTRDAYYSRYQFADLFAHVRRAPQAIAARVSEIEGIAKVDTRIVYDVTMIVEGMREPATARLISIPETTTPQLNQIYLRRGRMPEIGQGLEVLVGESFAEKHGLIPGDSVRAILNGRLRTLRIVGIALSPEYILQIMPGQLLPDSRRFAVFWVPQTALEAAFDMKGAFNDLTATVMPSANLAEVMRRIDGVLDPWGNVGCYGRDEQMSAKYVDDEIRQLRGTGLIVPIVFLLVAAFLLNIILSRQIQTQREQIAALKAFGYSNWQVGWHYFKLIAVIVGVSGILGTAVGAWMGHGLTQLYTNFYRFPLFQFQLDIRSSIVASSLSLLAASIGGFGALSAAVHLPPAEAMRPEAPAKFSRSLLEKLGLGRFFSRTARMVIRQLERRPLKSAFSCIGISLGTSVMVVGGFMSDALDYLIDFQFRLSQRDDVMVVFHEQQPQRVQHELRQLPGVMRVEPFRSLPVRMVNGPVSRRLSIMGIAPERHLLLLFDADEREQAVPDTGLLLSEIVANVLNLSIGDWVEIQVLEGQRPTRKVMVTGLIRDFGGMNAYMKMDNIHQLMMQPPLASGARITVDPLKEETLYDTLKQIPGISGVSVRKASIQSFIDTVAENQLMIQTFNIIFACIIASGVVYNTARISLAERSRELATLRVLGFTVGECSAILLGELAVLTSVAIPLGLLLGNFLTWLTTLGLQTEMYRIPYVVSSATWIQASVVVILATTASSLIVLRRIRQLDMIAVLKSPE